MTKEPVPHPTDETNDYHHLPATDKQLRFAQQIATGLGKPVPDVVRGDRRALSEWIDENRVQATLNAGRFASYPTSKQVAFAERIARLKRRNVPSECFRDKVMMSRWIDSNL